MARIYGKIGVLKYTGSRCFQTGAPHRSSPAISVFILQDTARLVAEEYRVFVLGAVEFAVAVTATANGAGLHFRTG
jgi:hypothetical protein